MGYAVRVCIRRITIRPCIWMHGLMRRRRKLVSWQPVSLVNAHRVSRMLNRQSRDHLDR
jgi:hypothetical protein